MGVLSYRIIRIEFYPHFSGRFSIENYAFPYLSIRIDTKRGAIPHEQLLNE